MYIYIFVINCRSRVKQKNERKLQRVHYIHTNIHLHVLYADVNTCMCTQYVHTHTIINIQGCGNSEPAAGHF